MLCWRPDPSERPSFAELVTSLELQLHSKEVRNEQSFKLIPRNDKIDTQCVHVWLTKLSCFDGKLTDLVWLFSYRT